MSFYSLTPILGKGENVLSRGEKNDILELTVRGLPQSRKSEVDCVCMCVTRLHIQACHLIGQNTSHFIITIQYLLNAHERMLLFS